MHLNRESTRKQQQIQLLDTIQRLRKDVAAGFANSGPTVTGASTSAAASSAEAAGRKQMLDMQQNLIDRLLTAKATGRIVLGVHPNAQTLEDVPDFRLEDGDLISVPARMETVQVIGEVYNENALRYRAGRRLTGYLKDTGGPTRAADMGRSYLIRADGTVIGKHMTSNTWSNNFGNIVLMPGDAVVVPPKIKLPSGAMDNLLQITGILSQAAITGAVLASVL
jgi:hypothetical protein